MFQQFKNIFPNASLNIRSITESVGINDTDWSRGVERVEALRNEFQNLNSIFLNRHDSNSSAGTITSTSKEVDHTSVKDLKATGKVIERLEEGWQSIHSGNLENFEKSQLADSKLRKLQSAGNLHYTVCVQMENTTTEIENIQNNLNEMQNSAARLLETLVSLEHEIDSVSVDHERRELELWKREQDQILNDEIQLKKNALSEKENKLKQQYEEYDSIQKKKRVELYEANFNAELEDYKRRRETEVSSLYSHHSNTEDTITTSLDQLQLDVDKNKDDLNTFLGEKIEPKKTKKEKEKKKSKKKSNTKSATTLSLPPSGLTSSDEDDRRVEILQDEDYEDFP